MTKVLWPIHHILWKTKWIRGVGRIWLKFLSFSPIVDYHSAYPQLGSKLLYKWAILDTHDTLTDQFKHLRDASAIQQHLQKCGMIEIETAYAGNGVEARARKANA